MTSRANSKNIRRRKIARRKRKNLRKNSRHFVSVCQYFGDLRFAVSFSPFSFCHGWHSFYFRLRRPLDGGRVAGSIPDSQSDSRLFILIQFFAWFFSANVSSTTFLLKKKPGIFSLRIFLFHFKYINIYRGQK
jgi:hypothetical protein